MAIAINLNDLCYPSDEIRLQVMSGNWPELSEYQWAILAGHPIPFMPWKVEPATREQFDLAKRKWERYREKWARQQKGNQEGGK